VHSEPPPTADWQYSPGRQIAAPPLPVGQLQRPLVRHAPPLLPERQRAFVPSQPQMFIESRPHTSPFCAVQLLPQPPQFVEFCVTLSSQPLSVVGKTGMVQLPNPSWHVESQTPPLHERDPTLVALHARPQPPQLRTSEAVFASQPSSTAGRVALQLVKPSMQVGAHSPATHARVVTFCAPHTWPHAPQCSGSVAVALSQPVAASLSQSSKPVAHVSIAHCPAASHTTVAFVLLQGAQLVAAQPVSGSLVLTQPPAHCFSPAAQPVSGAASVPASAPEAPAEESRDPPVPAEASLVPPEPPVALPAEPPVALPPDPPVPLPAEPPAAPEPCAT
jgi:hypothetical protein